MLIALHKGKGIISTLIRWQTRSTHGYSHVSVITNDETLRGYEAREFHGVRDCTVGLDHPNDTIDLYRVEGLTPEQERSVADFLTRQVGKPYDYTMVARFLSRRQADAPGLLAWLGINREESGRWFCSELAFAAFQQAGVDLLARCQPWEVSPARLGLSTRLVFVETIEPGDVAGYFNLHPGMA